MTPDQKLQSLSPVRLIIGYDKEGNFSSVICETKEDMVVAMDKYVGGKVYELVLSKELDWYKNKIEKHKKLNNG
jgi:hypothetical protein